ncbi:MAG: cell division protein FtsQ/DivIB [Candidatus Limnocylindrales bacterium]
MTLPVRSMARTAQPRVARASAGISPARVLAAVVLLASASGLYGVSSSDAFALDRLEIAGGRYTSPERVRDRLGLVSSARPNLFRLQTEPIRRILLGLPAVRDANVSVVLPDRVFITLEERAPILVWQQGRRRFLVDVEGRLFAATPEKDAAGVDLPVVVDNRRSAGELRVGADLSPVDLAVVRQLGALTPLTIGSQAKEVRLTVDDHEGFTLSAEPNLWRAIFGFYTPSLRTADIVPAQVQCLTALVDRGERSLRRVYLAPSGQRCGTFRAAGAP